MSIVRLDTNTKSSKAEQPIVPYQVESAVGIFSAMRTDGMEETLEAQVRISVLGSDGVVLEIRMSMSQFCLAPSALLVSTL